MIPSKIPVPSLIPSHVTRGGSVTPVKNLGWLLRNWKIVSGFRILPHPPVYDGMQPECLFIADLKGGGTYETGFYCKGVLRSFLHRPVFYSLAIQAPAFHGYFPDTIVRGYRDKNNH